MYVCMLHEAAFSSPRSQFFTIRTDPKRAQRGFSEVYRYLRSTLCIFLSSVMKQLLGFALLSIDFDDFTSPLTP